MMFSCGLKEIHTSSFELVERRVISVVENLSLEILPKTLNEIEVRRVGRQEDKLDLGIFEVSLNVPRPIVACIVADHVDTLRLSVLALQGLQQGHGRLCVDRRIESHRHTHCLDVDRAVDIDSSTARVARYFPLLSLFDLTVGRHWLCPVQPSLSCR